MRTVFSMLAVAAAACGGGGASHDISGRAFGEPVRLSHALAQPVATFAESMSIAIIDRGFDCGHPQNTSLKNLRDLEIDLLVRTYDPQARDVPPAKPGTFPVVSLFDDRPPEGNEAHAIFVSLDGACHPDREAFAQSGTVTLTSIDPPEGTLDLFFASGDRLSGPFAADACQAPATPTTPACF